MLFKRIVLCGMLLLAAAIPSVRAIDDDDRVLVWEAPGLQASAATDPGRIAYLDGGGRMETAIVLDGNIDMVMPCTERATSPGERYAVFYAGNPVEGTLYLVRGDDEPVEVATVAERSCIGMGSFRWSPDGDSFAYIDYQRNLQGPDFPSGTLLRYDASDISTPSFSADDVAAFDIRDDATAYVEALDDHVLVHADDTEVIQIFTDRANCRFRSAALSYLTPETLALALGQSCRGNTWALYLIDIERRSANRVLISETGANGGASFQANAQTLALFPATRGSTLAVTYAEGVLGNYSALGQVIDLRDVQPGDPFIQNAVMPRQPRQSDTAVPAISDDRRWMAFVQQPFSGTATLHIMDLASQSTVYTIDAGAEGATIVSMAFTQNSNRLIYLAGGIDGDDNVLHSVNLGSGESTRIVRGTFQPPLVAAPAGDEVLVQSWQEEDDIRFLTLDVVDVGAGTVETLVNRTQIVDGEIEDRLFVQPLFWRP
jgi:Tol biopolymer transport system component